MSVYINYLVTAILLFTAYLTSGQGSMEVLFLGNSYTNSNNLPQLLRDLALSKGDTLIYGSNTPGGYTLEGHSSNSSSQALIAQGNWDYVILQDQSQRPSLPDSLVEIHSIPYAIQLAQQIRSANPISIPMFFMTWGRKNGDAANCAWWPAVCTYAGMQSVLRKNYLRMADTTNAQVGAVGAVWREVRAKDPGIELYTADGSHPSLAGSYLAACSFYTSIYQKNPSGGFIPAGLDPAQASLIQDYAFQIVMDSLLVWNIPASFGTAENLVPGLSVAPNPSSKEIYLQGIPQGYGILKYRIYEISGKLIQKGDLKGSINIERLSKGTYVLEVMGFASPVSVKFEKSD